MGKYFSLARMHSFMPGVERAFRAANDIAGIPSFLRKRNLGIQEWRAPNYTFHYLQQQKRKRKEKSSKHRLRNAKRILKHPESQIEIK